MGPRAGASLGIWFLVGRVLFFSLKTKVANLRNWGDTEGPQLPRVPVTALFSLLLPLGQQAEWWPLPMFHCPCEDMA